MIENKKQQYELDLPGCRPKINGQQLVTSFLVIEGICY